MDTLELQKSKAVDAYDNGTKKEKQFLERLYDKKTFQKDVMERIKTFSDVLNELGIDAEKFEDLNKDSTSDEEAYRKLKYICKALNEGWTPNWDDSREYKYLPWFKMGSSGFRYGVYDGWVTYSCVGSRLCFKSAELAKYAGNQFEDIYKNFMTTN